MVVAVSMYMLMYPRVSVSTECGSTIILWFPLVGSLLRLAASCTHSLYSTLSCLLISTTSQLQQSLRHVHLLLFLPIFVYC